MKPTKSFQNVLRTERESGALRNGKLLLSEFQFSLWPKTRLGFMKKLFELVFFKPAIQSRVQF